MVPLFEPLAGDTVHHDVALDDADHDILELTPTELDPDPELAAPLFVVKLNVGFDSSFII